MLDYILQFYNNYTIFFYVVVIFIAIIEWPIIILWLSLIAGKLWFSFIFLYIISFLWDFLWDIVHFFIWRLFSKKYKNRKEFEIIQKLSNRLEKHSLFDKLIVIKYSPPLTSIWLIYLWYKEKKVSKFIINDALLVAVNSLFITFIWFYFWSVFKNNNDFSNILILFFFSIVIFYIWLKYMTKYLIKKIINGKNT